jgi:UDP-glucose 4-epimerase
MYSGVISRFIDSLLTGKPAVIYGDGEQSRDFTYITNVVDANLKAAQTTKGLGETMNVANGVRVTLNDLLELLKKITDTPDATADHQPPRRGDVKHPQADNTRAVECLGYSEIVGLEEGLRRTIDWWKTSRFALT